MGLGIVVDQICFGNEQDGQDQWEADLQLQLQLVVLVLILQYRYVGFCQCLHNLIDLAIEQGQIVGKQYVAKAVDQTQ